MYSLVNRDIGAEVYGKQVREGEGERGWRGREGKGEREVDCF